MSVGAGVDFWANLIYLTEKNGVDMGFGCGFLATKGREGKVESRGNRKMFSHMEYGFPIGGKLGGCQF
jgi:hypothetical protein